MALSDLETFIKERVAVWDETQDLSPGSPFDAKVIQPILRRLGTDPFSIDMSAFIETRLLQEFPDLANKNGDATTDLLEKPAIILFDPIVREIQRVRNSLSFKDPTILTIDEAEALGANLFADRNRGNFSTGIVRIYFAQPQPISVNPANFVTSQSGLHFFPTAIQSIRLEEMLFNVEGSLFYFDVNLKAEKAGDEYNIGPDELITIANVTAAVRITNKRRFRDGLPAENAVQFIDRAQQELTERSMVTLRGIASVVPATFPEITRLAVVGFQDPEMQRDVLEGGGLGPLRGSGVAGVSAPDGENKVLTRQVTLTEILAADPAGFLSIIGPASLTPNGWVLTVFNAFGGTPPAVRDLDVLAVIDAQNITLVEQVIFQSATPFAWCLRKKELTLSGIPGGILFPDSSNGTITVPDGQIHIGGATDILVRGVDFDPGTLTLSSVVDDAPLLAGISLQVGTSDGLIVINDFVLGTNYALNDATYAALAQAPVRGWTLQILEGPAAGSYRVLLGLQTPGSPPFFEVTPSPLYAATPDFSNLRWKLTDVLDIDLVEPKETKLVGSDMFSVQNQDILETTGGTSFDIFGVGVGDIVRIFNGPDASDYKVKQVLSPFFTRVQVDRELKFSTSNLKYAIFRSNAGGGVTRPLIRVTSIDLLDTSGQPVGSKIPYARPVDGRSTAFANVGVGVRMEARDGILGLVGPVLAGSPPGANVSGKDVTIRYNNGSNTTNVLFAGANPIPLSSIISQINAAVGSTMAVVIGGNRLGMRPFGLTEIIGGSAMPTLFNNVPGGSATSYHSSREINSQAVTTAFGAAGWSAIKPSVDINGDVLQVLDGLQIGFYNNPKVHVVPVAPFGMDPATGLVVDHDFAPEIGAFYQFGSRSIGTARAYFLEPTSIEFGKDSRFVVETAAGVKLNYKPDGTVNAQKIPALPSGVKPGDGDNLTVPSVSVMHSASTDFIQKSIQAGDQLVIDYVPLTGSINLADPVLGLQFLTLVLSIGGGPNKTVTFLTDSLAVPANAVTRAGVVTQINQAVGQNICSIVPTGGGNYLEFYPTVSVRIRVTGTANALLLGPFFSIDRSNDAENAGTYNIINVAQHDLTIDATIEPFGFQSNAPRQQFSVVRPGTQRLGATQMANNKADAGLYFFDVQLVSEGTGDLWNIDAGLQMTMFGFDADGYYLSTRNENLTFSPAEDVTLHVSRSIREVGVADDPDNATQISGQNLQVNYEFSSLTTALNNFAIADTERVINDSPLGRHLMPNFVRFDLTYVGGSAESIVVPALEMFIREIQPADALDSSDIQNIVLSKGASYIVNPLDLVAVVYGFDRSILINRSSDRLTTGRLAAFIPDILNVSRKTS